MAALILKFPIYRVTSLRIVSSRIEFVQQTVQNLVRGSRSSRLPTKPCVRVRTRLLMQLLSTDEVETNAVVFPLTLSTALLHQ
jgi:hypothetical protein